MSRSWLPSPHLLPIFSGKTFPKPGDTVTIHYVGTLLNGNKFDSSRDRGDPFVTQIGVGRVIKGWDEGVPQLSLGEKAYVVFLCLRTEIPLSRLLTLLSSFRFSFSVLVRCFLPAPCHALPR